MQKKNKNTTTIGICYQFTVHAHTKTKFVMTDHLAHFHKLLTKLKIEEMNTEIKFC